MANQDTIETANGSTADDILWGVDKIGQVINRNPRQTHYLLSLGEIKCAQQKGGRWVASRAALLRELGVP